MMLLLYLAHSFSMNAPPPPRADLSFNRFGKPTVTGNDRNRASNLSVSLVQSTLAKKMFGWLERLKMITSLPPTKLG